MDAHSNLIPRQLPRRSGTTRRSQRRIAWALAAAVAVAAPAAAEEPLTLEARIPLGDVAGRIDHMAFDLARRRLFVAELGNDSVGVVDVQAKRTIRTLLHLKEPQGVGYAAASDALYVANAGDGTVRLFRGADLAPAGTIALGNDADNIRVDAKAGQVFVGYGAGGIAVLDAASGEKRAEIRLAAHPEAFQLAPGGDRIYVNVPDAREVAVLDRTAQKQIARWPLRAAAANFPMAVEDEGARIVIAFRHPARLAALAAEDGRTLASIEVCGDADDVFADARRRRIYVSCGEGLVEVLERQGEGYRRLARVPTGAGARTALFVPELDQLFVGVRASGGIGGTTPAAIWMFRPSP